MKRTDGLTATRQIKGVFTDAKTIVVTNYKDKKSKESAIYAGAIGYVLKENLPDVCSFLIE